MVETTNTPITVPTLRRSRCGAFVKLNQAQFHALTRGRSVVAQPVWVALTDTQAPRGDELGFVLWENGAPIYAARQWDAKGLRAEALNRRRIRLDRSARASEVLAKARRQRQEEADRLAAEEREIMRWEEEDRAEKATGGEVMAADARQIVQWEEEDRAHAAREAAIADARVVQDATRALRDRLTAEDWSARFEFAIAYGIALAAEYTARRSYLGGPSPIELARELMADAASLARLNVSSAAKL